MHLLDMTSINSSNSSKKKIKNKTNHNWMCTVSENPLHLIMVYILCLWDQNRSDITIFIEESFSVFMINFHKKGKVTMYQPDTQIYEVYFSSY